VAQRLPRIESIGASSHEDLYPCQLCGQIVDRRRLADVLHHEEREHEPLEPDRPDVELKFIPPMMPTLRETVPQGDGWIHELKYDGYRTQVHISHSQVRAYTRNAYDWTARYKPIVECAGSLACASAILDGELIVQDEAGRSDFHALKAAIAREPDKLVLLAFDLLHLDGRDLRNLRLEQRRGLLERLLGPNDAGKPIQFSEAVADGKALFDAVEAMELEGIVSKRLGSRYRSGPAKAWLKTKCFCEEDLVVIGTERGDKAPTALLAREVDGRLVYAGGAMLTLPQHKRDLFWDAGEVLRTDEPPLAMKPRKGVSWIKPTMRVKVRTLRGEEMLRHATVRDLLAFDLEQSGS
jgi:bifunctional non-homologous end joining protein LigD